MEAAVNITYFVVCWKHFLGIWFVAVTAAEYGKRVNSQKTQTKALVNNEANATTPTILGSMKKNYFNYRLITSTTATIMEVIVTLLNVGIIHIANGKVY